MTDQTKCTYRPWTEADPPLQTRQCVHYDGTQCDKELPAGVKCPKPWELWITESAPINQDIWDRLEVKDGNS